MSLDLGGPSVITKKAGPVDVLICGGGFAGLTLAIQLRREVPEASIAILDKLERPFPEAAFKIGESTVELAAHYMRDILGLADYMDDRHLRKLGLRFFFKDDEVGDFADRPEVGLSKFATVPSYQIDRGRFENDLRAMVEQMGVRLIEGARIEEIEIRERDTPHKVTFFRDADGPDLQEIECRWVVDAAGRSRMLQRQLGLGKRRESDHHAVWFRVEGRVDMDDLVPRSNTDWHDRVPGEIRYYSTNHLVDTGYWVWIIPLSSGYTSVGIVADKAYHPLETFRTREKARDWLAANEPDFARLIEDKAWADFGVMRAYSHTSDKVFSAVRWACTGDAGVFADPMYAPGADLIAFANCCISHLVRKDMDGALTDADVEEKSRFVISFGELLTRSIQINYHLLGHPNVMAAKLFWDILAGWSFVQPLFFGQTFLDGQKHKAVRSVSRNFFYLSLQMNNFFGDWAAKGGRGGIGYKWIDYFAVDEVRLMRDRNLRAGKTVDELVEDQKLNMLLVEEMAIVLFRIAVRDCHPELYHKVADTWINAWAISLDPSTWEERGLFRPTTEPRDLSHFEVPLYQLFNFVEVEAAA